MPQAATWTGTSPGPRGLDIAHTLENGCFHGCLASRAVRVCGTSGIVLQMLGKGTKLIAEVKKWANHINAGVLINRMQRVAEPGHGLLVADYINPNMVQKLKEAGIQFIDTAGNAYINQPPVYIYVKGNRPEVKAMARVETGKAFQPAGMKIVFAFLSDRQLVGAPYRKIAERAQVALGAVGGVIRDLLEQNILVEKVKSGRRELADFDRLLDKWVEAYPHKLREKQRLDTFTTDNADWWKAVDPSNFGAVWGGEIAAAQYTNYLNPRDAVVYIRKTDMAGFLKAARLKKVQANESYQLKIELMEPFWQQDKNVDHPTLVHPLIVYADLIATGDPRNLDTANRLREKYLG